MESFTDFLRRRPVRWVPVSLDAPAADYLKVGDLRQVGQNVVLDTVNEVGVVFYRTEIVER